MAMTKKEREPVAQLDASALANEIRSIDGNHTMGAGALAEALMPLIQKATPAAGDARKPDFARAEKIAADFVQDYEWRGEDVAGRDTCYTPNKRERAMITDAILGLLAEPEFVAALAAQVPQQGEA